LKRKLNYRFHNPNSVEDTAEFLCKMLVEINQDKVEKAIQKAAKLSEQAGEYISDVKEN
jgi:hypothetical protein